jgi:dihydroneopterin aldolase
MSGEMEIHLRNVRIYGYHGVHAGEEILGGEYQINLTAHYIPQAFAIDAIDHTLDYTALLTIVKERMQERSNLLETVAVDIASEIIVKFSMVTEVVISIYKLHPPIANFEGSVGVTYKLNRN